jgi:Domain of unknown function (DUF1995)
MRRLLESAWNQTTMGRIPTTPELAVQECVEAWRHAESRSGSKIFFIDLLLPQYDISAGSKVYDALLMVEFAMLLMQRLPRRAMLAVRDQRVLHSVARVLNARGGRDVTQVPSPAIEYDDDFASPSSAESEIAIVVVEDRPVVEFDDFGAAPVLEHDTPLEETAEESSISHFGTDGDDDIASFRELLLQNWNSTNIEDLDSIRDEERLWDEEEDNDDDNNLSPEDQSFNYEEPQYYRLTSLLGSHPISSGADMMNDVVAAVKENALPLDEEEVLVFLSPCTKAEQYAIRALVSRYEFNKTMLFINCQLDPLPQELLRGTTIYSILPLIAKPRSGSSETAPKIVVLRRYPQAWQVHVDRGRGFQQLPTTFTGSLRGPSMEWIQTVVLRYLQSRPPT